jgi:hypothetical protein
MDLKMLRILMVALLFIFYPCASFATPFWAYDDATDLLSSDEFLVASPENEKMENITWADLILEIVSEGGLFTLSNDGTGSLLDADYLDGVSIDDFVLESEIGSLVQSYDVDIPTSTPTEAEAEAGTETTIRSWSTVRVWDAIEGYLRQRRGEQTPLTAEPDNEWVGQIVLADNDNWDPTGVDGDDPYWCICTATGTPGTWIAFLSSTGSLLVSSIDLFEYTPDNLYDTTTPHYLQDYELRGTLITNYGATGSIVYDFPELSEGINFKVQAISEAGSITLHPHGEDAWYLNGVALDTDDLVNASPTIGDTVDCFSARTSSSAWALFCKSVDAGWAATASATDYTADANCMGAWFMNADGGSETDRSGEGETLSEMGDTVTRSATVPSGFGGYSRFLLSTATGGLTHADGGSTDFYGADQAISVVAWIRPNVLTSKRYIASKGGISTNLSWRFFIDGDASDRVSLSISSDGTTISTAVGATTIGAEWHHVAFVYDDTDVRIYVDGELDSNGASNPLSYTAGLYNSSANFSLGQAGSYYYRGDIDEVAIFDRALSAAEIAEIYASGLTGDNGGSD